MIAQFGTTRCEADDPTAGVSGCCDIEVPFQLCAISRQETADARHHSPQFRGAIERKLARWSAGALNPRVVAREFSHFVIRFLHPTHQCAVAPKLKFPRHHEWRSEKFRESNFDEMRLVGSRSRQLA